MDSLKRWEYIRLSKEIIEIISETEAPRLDAYLSQQLNQLSRSYIQKLIQSGAIFVNGVRLQSKKAKVTTGDSIVIELPEPEVLNIAAENIPIDILYEDEDVIVVNKPQGMVVHPAPGHYSGTLVNALMYHATHLSSINGTIRPGIVHRIDKDTSGLLMVAKNDKAHESLASQLKAKTSLREYVAIANGIVKDDAGIVDAPIGRHPTDRLKMAIVTGGRDAVTHYEVIERLKYHSYLRLRLETGRTHQIRVHMASIGYPLLGDPLYGVKQEKVKHDGQLLHAKMLGFIHPSTGELMIFEAPLPAYFENILSKCRGL
jgi:23S rRNA pseudouridine1911/1915/1917 synthase